MCGTFPRVWQKINSKSCKEICSRSHAVGEEHQQSAITSIGHHKLVMVMNSCCMTNGCRANHVANIHSWNGEKMTSCEHGVIEDDDIAWLDIDSPAHVALKDVVLSSKLLKDVGKLSTSLHTGSLEAYHSMLLKYAPKRQHFHYTGMQSRLQLAALDHTHNVSRDLALRPPSARVFKVRLRGANSLLSSLLSCLLYYIVLYTFVVIFLVG